MAFRQTGHVGSCGSCIGVGRSGIGNGGSGFEHLEADLVLSDFDVVCGGGWADFFSLLGMALALAKFGGSRVDLYDF